MANSLNEALFLPFLKEEETFLISWDNQYYWIKFWCSRVWRPSQSLPSIFSKIETPGFSVFFPKTNQHVWIKVWRILWTEAFLIIIIARSSFYPCLKRPISPSVSKFNLRKCFACIKLVISNSNYFWQRREVNFYNLMQWTSLH